LKLVFKTLDNLFEFTLRATTFVHAVVDVC
jgi:hypothetical protein